MDEQASPERAESSADEVVAWEPIEIGPDRSSADRCGGGNHCNEARR